MLPATHLGVAVEVEVHDRRVRAERSWLLPRPPVPVQRSVPLAFSTWRPSTISGDAVAVEVGQRDRAPRDPLDRVAAPLERSVVLEGDQVWTRLRAVPMISGLGSVSMFPAAIWPMEFSHGRRRWS